MERRTFFVHIHGLQEEKTCEQNNSYGAASRLICYILFLQYTFITALSSLSIHSNRSVVLCYTHSTRARPFNESWVTYEMRQWQPCALGVNESFQDRSEFFLQHYNDASS